MTKGSIGCGRKTYIVIFEAIGMFERAVMCDFLHSVVVNVALIPGSSKQGKAFLASVAWYCVVAMYL